MKTVIGFSADSGVALLGMESNWKAVKFGKDFDCEQTFCCEAGHPSKDEVVNHVFSLGWATPVEYFADEDEVV